MDQPGKIMITMRFWFYRSRSRRRRRSRSRSRSRRRRRRSLKRSIIQTMHMYSSV